MRKNGTETRNREVHTDNSTVGFLNWCYSVKIIGATDDENKIYLNQRG